LSAKSGNEYLSGKGGSDISEVPDEAIGNFGSSSLRNGFITIFPCQTIPLESARHECCKAQ
jgi:hypothetical protein